MKKLTKTLALVLALAMVLTALIACGKTNTTAPTPAATESTGAETAIEPAAVSGKLVFWTQDSVTWQNYFGPALERFKAAYPDVDVQVEYFSSFADKINQAFAANTEADVVFTWQSVTDWAKAGRILEVPSSVYTVDDFANYFYSGAMKNKIYDGKYYAVSDEINVESPQLYVNMDHIANMGVSLPDGWVENNGPANWDELVAFAKQVTVRDASGTITQSGLSYAYAQWEAMLPSLIWQMGGDYRDEANNTVNFKTPEAKAAIEFMLNYMQGDDAICSGTTNRFDEFAQGLAAMCVGAPWYAGSFDIDIPDTNYQVFNLPPFIDGADPICQATGGWAYIVSSNCENTDAAWAFVKFMTSADEVGKWAYTTGALPSRNDSLTDLTYDPTVGSVDKAIAIATLILPYAQEDGAYLLTPSKLTYSIIREALYQLIEDGDIDACLNRIQSETETMIMENNER
jgi:ABC-type glycerol-3-phosphate transport system substrate-binding protein